MITNMLYLILIILTNLVIFFLHDKVFKYLVPIDNPDNIRKFHKKPVLISGGIILAINVIIFIFFINFTEINFIISSDTINKIYFWSIIFFIFGFLDDKININAWLKLFLMILFLIILFNYDQSFIINELRFSFYDQTINLGKYSILVTLICYLLFINAFNMFDGINLQSIIFSLSIIFFFISIKFLIFLNTLFLIPFLLFFYLNFKNQSFLGDGGCYLLSFLFGSCFVISYNNSIINYCDIIFILMILPGFDMLRLFLQRIFNKTSPFNPDRNHLHHILLKKLNYNKTIIVITSIITLNIMLLHLNVDSRLILVIFLFYYFSLVFKFRD